MVSATGERASKNSTRAGSSLLRFLTLLIIKDEGALDTFISDNGLDFPHMSHDEFSDLESDLFLLNQSLGNNEKPSPEHYYKVRFLVSLFIFLFTRNRSLLKKHWIWSILAECFCETVTPTFIKTPSSLLF